VEIALIVSWTLLANSLLGLLSGGSLLLVPVAYILAVSILAWLEDAGTTRKLDCPLQAFGLALITLDGGRPGQWNMFRRLFLLIPLTLLAGAAFIPVRGRECHLLQFLSGTRLVPLDTSMDPRIPSEVVRGRRRAMRKVLGYLLSSVAVAVMILLIPERNVSASGRDEPSAEGLPAYEVELLAGYLEMAAIYPDSIEFHVRLASLYYRNGMTDDLETELEAIAAIDPDHPMLLLGDVPAPSFDDMEVTPESPDSAETDTLPALQVTVTASDSQTVHSDSIISTEQAELQDSSATSASPESDSLQAPELTSGGTPMDSIGLESNETESLTVPADTTATEARPDSLPELEEPEAEEMGTPVPSEDGSPTDSLPSG